MKNRKHLTALEVDKFLAATKGSRNATRDRCLLLLTFRYGLRVSEACGLDFRDVRLIFDGWPAVHVPSYKNDEVRFASVKDRKRGFTRLFGRGEPSGGGEERAYREIHDWGT